jgi:hypothetical protein
MTRLAEQSIWHPNCSVVTRGRAHGALLNLVNHLKAGRRLLRTASLTNSNRSSMRTRHSKVDKR